MKKIVVGLALLALSGLSVNASSDDDDYSGGKTSVCHKGRTVTINQSGVPGHLGVAGDLPRTAARPRRGAATPAAAPQ